MKIEEIENATDAQLRQQLIDCFALVDNLDQLAGSILLRKVRFFQDEIERRENTRVSRRDLRLELTVILLICAEIVLAVVLAIVGVRQQTRDVNQELAAFGQVKDVLSNLQETSKATASLLEQELDLEYTLSINIEYDGFESIMVFNNSRSKAILGGVRVDGVVRKIKDGRPYVIADHNMVRINLSEYNPKLLEKGTGKTKPFTFPIEIYIVNARGQEFVWKGRLTWGNSSGLLSGVPNGQLVIEPWAPEVKPAVSQVSSVNP